MTNSDTDETGGLYYLRIEVQRFRTGGGDLRCPSGTVSRLGRSEEHESAQIRQSIEMKSRDTLRSAFPLAQAQGSE